ncbi:cholesterol 7-alpha-monooxygenase [Rhypophila decipiens]|uniref:Cholesterol 7-alpha-monooxygenase n=1 Tax=Rhypophila decipiens TaxID=261697 RepID=A0AAN6Y4X4_9PEZI|nr:cholesterol 7-alpha-monooxygenase [Rhypophila decipiens]
MAGFLSVAFGVLVATYIFLRVLLHLTQDSKEPPAILTAIPFFGPIKGIVWEKSGFFVRLRDTYNLPIYTLRLPFMRIYVVNSTDLIPPLHKQWLNVSFASITVPVGNTIGFSEDGMKLLKHGIGTEKGFTESWPRHVLPSISPGPDLDAINRKAIQVFADEMAKLRTQGSQLVPLRSWSRKAMVAATSEAIWGEQNPYRDPEIAEEWRIFESGFLTLALFPAAAKLFPRIHQARERLTKAMLGFVNRGGQKQASGLVAKRYEHHVDIWKMKLEDFARGEIGNSFAVLGNSTPCAFWVLWHIFSDDQVLADVRNELSGLVEEGAKDGAPMSIVDLSMVKSACPILLSTFMETMRYRTVNSGPRHILEDVEIGGYLVKKGNMLMLPGPVQHTSREAWGDNAHLFDHLRFTSERKIRPNRVAFRAFGGGHTLCPGQHFATTEIMALAALLVLQFDMVPVESSGKWVEPSCDNTPFQAGFPIPDTDFPVVLQPRDPQRKWRVMFSGSENAVGVVAEDLPAGAN